MQRELASSLESSRQLEMSMQNVAQLQQTFSTEVLRQSKQIEDIYLQVLSVQTAPSPVLPCMSTGQNAPQNCDEPVLKRHLFQSIVDAVLGAVKSGANTLYLILDAMSARRWRLPRA